MDYKIIKYSPSYFDSFSDLLIQSFPIENKDKLSGVKWKFFHPFHNGKQLIYIATTKEFVVSQYTNLPFTICMNEVGYKSMLCADMSTRVEHRGQGLISKLSQNVYHEVVSKGYDFSVGFSNEQGVQVDKHASGYGYVIVGKVTRYFKILLFSHNSFFKFRQVDHFDKTWKCPQTNKFRVHKSHKYLTWRYVDKPNNNYTFLEIIHDSKRVGYVVLRIKRMNVYVYDLLLEDYREIMLKNVLNSIEQYALSKRFHILIVTVLDNVYWKTLFDKLHYFQKKYTKVHYYFTIRIHNTKLDDKKLTDKNNWLLMNGDIL